MKSASALPVLFALAALGGKTACAAEPRRPIGVALPFAAAHLV